MTTTLRWLQFHETECLLPTENANIARDTEGGFWFWDEIGTAALGPYPTLSAALEALDGYVKWLNDDQMGSSR